MHHASKYPMRRTLSDEADHWEVEHDAEGTLDLILITETVDLIEHRNSEQIHLSLSLSRERDCL